MQRSTFKSLSLLVVGSLAALALSGCGTTSQDTTSSSSGSETQTETQTGGTPTTNDSTSGSAGKAVLSYQDTTYSAELTFCSLSAGGDALFHGVATDDSGNEVGYLDGDFGDLGDIPYGEVRINFGAANQFESTDNFVSMGDAASDIVITDSSDTSLIVVGGAWAQDGTELSTATLRVTC